MSSNDPTDRPDEATEEHEPAPRAKPHDHDADPDRHPEPDPEHSAEHGANREQERARSRDRARAAEGDPVEDEDRKGRFSRLTRLLMDRGEDAKYVLGTVLDSSDRAKTEMVRMVAREVRNYLEALKLTEDLREFATNHSLEVKASFRLKPIADEDEPDDDEEEAPPSSRRRRKSD